MKWRLLLAVILGLSVSHVATFAQRPPDAERLSTSRASPELDAFFSSSGVVRFQLIQGRLGLNPLLHRKGAQQRQTDDAFESITVTADRGIPSLHYVLKQSMTRSSLSLSSLSKNPAHHITLSVDDATEVKIESEFTHTAERSVLQQPEFGTIQWQVTRGDLQESYTGTTLFHVRLQNPSVFDLHYADLTSRVLRGKSIGELSDQIQAAILSGRTNLPEVTLDQVAKCVEQLRSPRHGVRMSAQQQLLNWGTPIIPMLQQMFATDLDFEQRVRMIKTIQLLRPRVEDTPRSLAMLVVNDREFWSLTQSRLNQYEWIAVNQHLQQVGLSELQQEGSSFIQVASQPR